MVDFAAKTKVKKEKAETQVALKEKSVLATIKDNKELAAFYGGGQEDDFTQDDLMVPRILLAQSQSKYVVEEKAKAGQLVGSLQHNILADRAQSLEIIPFYRNKTFRLFKPQAGGGSPKFITEVPYSLDTKAWERSKLREVSWTYKNLEGIEVTEKLLCFITWNYYVLLPTNIEGLPCVISFSSTSYTTGKMLGTMIAEESKKGIPMPFKTYQIKTEAVSNEKGNFYKLLVSSGRETLNEELALVTEWAALANKGDIKVDSAEEESNDSMPAPAPTVARGVVNKDDEF